MYLLYILYELQYNLNEKKNTKQRKIFFVICLFVLLVDVELFALIDVETKK